MTTIATDGKSMAGDGLVTSGTAVFGRAMCKVRRLPDGRIVGTAGRCGDGHAFIEWLEKGGDKPKLGDEFEALVLLTDGSCLSYDENCYPTEEELPTASGSGRQWAMAMMDIGKTPGEAIAYAETRDTCTGGVITELELHVKPKLEAA